MSRVYTLPLRDPTNATLVADLSDNQLELSATANLNNSGTCTITLIHCDYPLDLFDEDQILNVWVKPDGANQFLLGDRSWFLEYFAEVQDETGRRNIELIFGDGNKLMDRRIVAYPSEQGQTETNNEPCDDVIKRVARQNGAVTANTGSYNIAAPDNDRSMQVAFQVQADAGAAPGITKVLEHKTLLPLFQELTAFSEANGTRLYFDVVQINPAALPVVELQTFIGQRGVDRTQATGGANARVISPDNGTIGTYRLANDYRKTARRSYVGSRGDGGGRTFATATEAGLAAYLAAHPLALREKFKNVSGLDAGEANFAAKLQTEADTQLQANLPFVQLDGTIAEGDGFRFGVDWRFGDRVTAAVNGVLFDVDINSLTVTLADGRETIAASLSNSVNRSSLTGSGTVFAAVAGLQRAVGGLEVQEVP